MINYPSFRVADVVLRDGSTMRVRPVRPDDVEELAALFERLSDDSIRLRFHGTRHPALEELRKYADVDYADRFGLVVEGAGRIVALASYVATRPGVAEIAIAVDDAVQGRGLGSILIEHLAEAAGEAGITTFEAEVLSSNGAMLDVIHATELPVKTSLSAGVVHAEFPTAVTPEALWAFERREAFAAAAGVAGFLRPRSIAVVGASRRRGTIGGELFRNLLDAGFTGPVYPVNPHGGVVQSVPAYASVLEVPGDVDLAVVVVPAADVLDVVQQCADKGVSSLLVISSGFSEIGGEGTERQARLAEIARRHGMRIIGPNCMGIMNTDEQVRMNASFSPVYPRPGRLAFSSQSGALGIAVIDRANRLGLGISSFVSVGNKADISGNDLLQYWEQDQKTDVILLYLESFGNPRKFARLARRVSREKPIVAVKSGRSGAGARAAASHTGSLAAGDIAVDALFRQAGVIRTDTLEELFDVASLVETQPLPAGKRVGIVTNAGGLGIMCADACSASGLDVPALRTETQAELRKFLPAEAGVGNPVDLIASATPDQYAATVTALADGDEVDSIIAIFIPPLVTRAEDVADALLSAVRDGHALKPVLACFLGVEGIHERLTYGDKAIPSHPFPEAAARALGRVAGYAEWRRRPEGSVPVLDHCDRRAAQSLMAEILQKGERWLEPQLVNEILDCYSIPRAKSFAVASVNEVATAADEIGGPVALKIASGTILHKTDVGGVRLGLESGAEARAAAEEILSGLEAKGLADHVDGWLVQEMVAGGGAEMFVGMTLDPSFGPLIACGTGGVLVELLQDVSVRITPLTDVDARDMLRSLRTYPLFRGYRGGPALDESAVEELLLRLSAMVEDLPHIAEIDLNPVIVFERDQGCKVVDARMRIMTPSPPPPRGARTRR